jgi:SAM-dependent methyltransferase
VLEYSAFNELVFNKVPASAVKILDVGCGTGIMGKVLKEQKKDRFVHGVTYSDKEYHTAIKFLDKISVLDINNETPDLNMKFNCIIFSHILEHTYEPEKILKGYSEFLDDDGLVIVALPNVLQYKQRSEFIKGNFKYSPGGGLMDITHFRFFDWLTAQEMIQNSGLEIISKEASGNFPLPFVRKLMPSFSRFIDRFSLKHWPGLFAFQFVFVAKK